MDASVASDEAVAGDSLFSHAKVGGSVGDEFVGLFEGALVEEEVDALAGGELAEFVLAGASLGASAFFSDGVAGG
jgi:hypothetical protein